MRASVFHSDDLLSLEKANEFLLCVERRTINAVASDHHVIARRPLGRRGNLPVRCLFLLCKAMRGTRRLPRRFAPCNDMGVVTHCTNRYISHIGTIHFLNFHRRKLTWKISIRNIFRNILNSAVQNAAQRIQRKGTDTLVFS